MTPGTWLTLIPLLHIAAISWPLAATDIREHRLPNRLTLPAIVVTQVCLLVASLLDSAWQRYQSAIFASAVVATVGILLALANTMGMGDTKLLLSTTPLLAWHSATAALAAAIIALLLAGGWAIAAMLLRSAGAANTFALGPFLLLGFAAVALGVVTQSIDSFG